MLAVSNLAFTAVHLVFDVFQTKVTHLCFGLVHIKMSLLICSLKCATLVGQLPLNRQT